MAKAQGQAKQAGGDPLVSARHAIERIFGELHITRVVYVDDLFERGNDDRVNVVVGLLGQNPQVGPEVLPNISFDRDQDLWEIDVRRWWDEAQDDVKDGITRRIGEAVQWQNPVLLDHVARSALRTLLPAAIAVEEIAPSDWLGKRELLTTATADARILCLFDRELGNFEVAGRLTDGIDLLVEAVESVPNGEVIFGLFSHGFAPGDERREWERIARERSLNQDQFLPLSKRRQADPAMLAAGLETMTLNMFCDRLKHATVEAFKKAVGIAAEKFCELDVYEFESMVLRSAWDEGVWEPEFLLRLFQVFHRDEVHRIVSEDAFAARVNADVRFARAVSLNRPTTPTREPAERWLVRHRELFESESLLNASHTPLRTGDLFEAAGKLYVLLAQPCDLAVRSKTGRRKSFVVPLVQMSPMSAYAFAEWRKKRLAEGEDVLATRGLMQYFKEDTNDVALVEFKSAFPVSTDVLDLAVLGRDGACSIDLSAGFEPPVQLTNGWRLRAEAVVNNAHVWRSKLDEYQTPVSNVADEKLRERLWRDLMPRAAPAEMPLDPEPYKREGRFDFGLRRIAHYRQPGSTRLLANYSRYLSRDAEEYDIGRL